jgi:hypothetical protein
MLPLLRRHAGRTISPSGQPPALSSIGLRVLQVKLEIFMGEIDAVYPR